MGPVSRLLNSCLAALVQRLVGGVATLVLAGVVGAPSAAEAQSRSISDGCLAENSDTSDLTCTANDVRISRAFASSVIDGCDPNDSDPANATFALGVEIQSTANQRYDIGAFIPEDGVDARAGECRIISFNHVNDPQDPGQFRNFDQDVCGDVQQGDLITVSDIGTFTVECRDDNRDGFLDIDSCLSWDNQAEASCTGPGDVGAATPSKCRCEPLQILLLPVPPCQDVDCSFLDDECNQGVCVPTTGECVAEPKPNGTECQDGDVCTSDDGTPGDPDQCLNGVCTGVPVDCSGEDDQCNAGVCDPATGSCVKDPGPQEGASCDDGFACTSDGGVPGDPDECRSGTCTGDPVNCDDGEFCTADSCVEPDGCVNDPGPQEGVACQDGLACTSATTVPGDPDECRSGTCEGDPVACNDGEFCTADSCVEPGGCMFDPGPQEGAPCEDGDVCTSADSTPQSPDECRSGTCEGEPVDCSAEDDDCNDGVCDPTTGACEKDPVTDGTPCEDGEVCTSADTTPQTPDQCLSGICTGEPVDCDDEEGCTDDSCDSADGACLHQTIPSDPQFAVVDARAYGASLVLFGNEVIAPQPDSNEGSPQEAGEIPADPLVHVDLLNVQESETVSSPDSASTSAEARATDVFLLDQGTGNWTVTATAIRATSSSEASAAGASSHGECEIVNAKVGGMNLGTVTEPVSIDVFVPGLGAEVTVKLCERIATGAAAGEPQPDASGATSSSLVVKGIHIVGKPGALEPVTGETVIDLVVSHAESAAAHGVVCVPLPQVSGEAFVVGVNVDEEIVDPDNTLLDTKVGRVLLPSTGGVEDATLAHVGPIGDGTNLLVESNTAFSHTEGTVGAGSASHAQVEDLDALDAGEGPNLTADVVRAECTAGADGSVTARTLIASLSIGGTDLPAEICNGSGDPTLCEPAPNTELLPEGLPVRIVLNEQFDTSTVDKAEITVNAIHVYALGGDIPLGGDVVVASAHCDATVTNPPPAE